MILTIFKNIFNNIQKYFYLVKKSYQAMLRILTINYLQYNPHIANIRK